MSTTATSEKAAPGEPAPLLRLTGIRKSFSGVPALRDVRFELLPGEVHALAGENGDGGFRAMRGALRDAGHEVRAFA